MKTRVIAACILALAIGTIPAQAAGQQEPQETAVAGASTSGFDPDPGMPVPEAFTNDEAAAGAEFLASLARDTGATTAEALQRTRLQVAAHGLNGWLAEEHADQFAGTWLSTSPPFTINVAVTNGSESIIRQAMTTWFPDADSVEIHSVKHSLGVLRNIHNTALEAVPADLVPTSERLVSRIDVQGNVVSFVHPDEAMGDALNAHFPADAIEFRVGTEEIVDDADYIGGLRTTPSGCTTGFTVRKNSSLESGATTAGHCTNSTGISGISEPFGPLAATYLGGNDPNVDVQWRPLTHRNWTPTNQIKVNNNGNRVTIRGRVAYASISVGDYYCMYGVTSGYQCGFVESLACCSPGHQFVEAGYHSAGGDSGAPVYEFAEPYFHAVGMHKGRNASSAIFSSLTFYEQRFGVTVATATPPTPAFDWFLRDSNNQGVSNTEWEFGDSGATSVRGRWSTQGGGSDRPGSYKSGIWDLEGQARFTFGTSSDLAVVGDWDNDDIDEAGYFRPSSATFYRHGSSSIAYGNPGDKPVAGDWDGDGDDEIGVWRPSEARFYLRNSNGTTTAIYFGTYTDLPIVGDWDDDGVDEVGVFRPSTATWYLQGYAGFVYGNPTDKPLPGDWNADGRDTVGVVR